MRLLFKGEHIEGENYVPGSIVRMPDGRYRVHTYQGAWEDTAAPVDLALFRDGKDGRDGRNGDDGRDGADAEPAKSFNPRGKWKRGAYDVLDVVTHEGSSYVAIAPTQSEPPGKAWQVLAKAGADGEDGLNGGRGPRGPAGSGIEPVTAVFDSPAQRGDVVYVSGPGHVDLAQANSDPPARAIGLANGDGTYMVAGPFNCDAWNLSPGAMYFLDPVTPGGITTVCPVTSGHYIIVIGVATTPTQINVQIHYSMVLEA